MVVAATSIPNLPLGVYQVVVYPGGERRIGLFRDFCGLGLHLAEGPDHSDQMAKLEKGFGY
jgi:hypothetical protein